VSAANILSQLISRFQTPSARVLRCADLLRGLGFKACAMENLGASERAQPASIDLEGVALEEVLDRIKALNPGYLWAVAQGDLINIYPVRSVLDERVAGLQVSGKGVWRVLREDLEIEQRGLSIFMESAAGDGPTVDLRLESADLRAALNQIVGQLGDSVWHISGNPGAYTLSFTGVERRS